MDVCEITQPDSSSDEPKFSPILDVVSQSLDGRQGLETLVILDDVATLEWIGHSSLDIWRFVRTLRSVCLKVRKYWSSSNQTIGFWY